MQHKQSRKIVDNFFFFKDLYEESPYLLAVLDKRGYFLEFNKKWTSVFEYSKEDFQDKIFLDFVHPDDREKIRKKLNRCFDTGKKVKLKTRFCSKKGNDILMQWQFVCKNKSIFVYGEAVSGSDSTTSKQFAAHELPIFSNTEKFGVWELDLLRDEMFWSDGTKMIHEVAEDFQPTIQKTLNFYKKGHNRDKINRILKRAISEGKKFDNQFEIVTQKGNVKWVRSWGKPIFDNNRCIKLVGNIQDITEFKRNELQLKHQQQKLENTIEAARLGTWEYDVQSGKTNYNRRWAEIVGYRLDELKPLSIDTFLDLLHPDDEDRLRANLEKCLKGETDHYECEIRLKHKKGHWVWVLDIGKVLTWSEEGKPLTMYGILLDISEQKHLITRLRESEEAFRNNFEYAGIGMTITSTAGKWVQVNQKCSDILGFSVTELSNMHFRDITHPDDLEEDLALMEEVMEGKRDSYQMNKRYIHKKGHIIHALLSVAAVRNRNGEVQYFVSQIIDITDKIAAQNKLKQTLADLQAVMDASTEVTIIGTDKEGTIISFNKGAERMLGYKAEEVINSNITPVKFHEKEEIAARSEELSKKYNTRVEGFDVFTARVKQGKPETKEWTHVTKEGQKRPVLLTVTAIKQDKKITGFLGIAVNLTEIKKTEKKLREILKVTIEQNDRLKNFAHIVNHNIRSHSANIQNLLEVLKMDEPDIYKNDIVKFIAQSSVKLQDTVRNLSKVTKLVTDTQLNFKKINIKEVVEKVGRSIQTDHVEFINNVAATANVRAVPEYVHNIFYNIIENSLKYRSEKRKSVIKIDSVKQKGKLTVQIRDNGMGIDMERHKHKLFGMYKTFHENTDSKGLGLFISKYQMEAMGGHIEIESKPDHGTNVKLHFKHEQH